MYSSQLTFMFLFIHTLDCLSSIGLQRVLESTPSQSDGRETPWTVASPSQHLCSPYIKQHYCILDHLCVRLFQTCVKVNIIHFIFLSLKAKKSDRIRSFKFSVKYMKKLLEGS